MKNKKVLFLKKYFFGRTAKVHPKDGVSRLNFPEGFDKQLRRFHRRNLTDFSEIKTIKMTEDRIRYSRNLDCLKKTVALYTLHHFLVTTLNFEI